MASRVVLHIGARKTATSYIQRCLQVLAARGDIDPGMYPLDTRGADDHNHVPGMIDLLRTYDEIPLQADAWGHLDGSAASALIDRVRDTPGTVVISAEALASTRLAGARTAVAAFAPADVTVLVTTRALGRVLTSSWAQHVRNGNIETFNRYLSLRAEERQDMATLETRAGRAFWRAYAYGQLVRRWQATGADVVVATVPPAGSDPDVMWERFRTVTGLTSELPAQPPRVSVRKSNSSLALEQTYVLQGFNVAAKAAGHDRRWIRREHRRLLRNGLTPEPGNTLADGIPEHMQDEVRRWQETDAQDLASAATTLEGSISDLQTPLSAAPSAEQIIESLTDAAGRSLLGLHTLHHPTPITPPNGDH